MSRVRSPSPAPKSKAAIAGGFFVLVTTIYQTPLSLPVTLYATAAAVARYGSSASRNVAGTSPLNDAFVICVVYSGAPQERIGTRRNPLRTSMTLPPQV